METEREREVNVKVEAVNPNPNWTRRLVSRTVSFLDLLQPAY
jgi:hypothetical protein